MAALEQAKCRERWEMTKDIQSVTAAELGQLSLSSITCLVGKARSTMELCGPCHG